ncbi:MAG TPA: hypothetical protein VHB02_04565 [Acidimicrobiales bacterium]|nr:hypothetical protein [Acidimicrobiales bacterium]
MAVAVLGVLLPSVAVAAVAAVPTSPAVAATSVTGCGAGSPHGLAPGQVLASGACLVSASVDYELIMQSDGNLVLYFESQADPLWASGTDGHSGAYAVMQSDGNLVVYPAGDTAPAPGQATAAVWASGTDGTPNAVLAVQTDGNAVVYGNNAVGQGQGTTGAPYAAWSTGTQDLRGYELRAGDLLQPGQYLGSQDGQYGLTIGQAGAFVLFQTGRTSGYRCPMWSEPAVVGANPLAYAYDTTNPIGTTVAQSTTAVGAYPSYYSGSSIHVTPIAGAYMDMQSDGNLVMYAPNGTALWATGTTDYPGAYAELQDDGNVVVYSSGGTALWSTHTSFNREDRGWALCTGSRLYAGQQLRAAPWTSGTYMTMKTNCDLVIIDGSGNQEWTSNTDDTNGRNFTKSEEDSTLYGLPGNLALYEGCYATMEPTGNLALIAPSCPATTCNLDGVPHAFFASFTSTVGPLVQMPLHSFGPFLAYPTDTGTLNIDNGAGFLVAQNPAPYGSKSGLSKDLWDEIKGWMLMVTFALL